MEHISKEQWESVTKLLRQRTSAYIEPEQLSAIDNFIQLAASQFDQVRLG